MATKPGDITSNVFQMSLPLQTMREPGYGNSSCGKQKTQKESKKSSSYCTPNICVFPKFSVESLLPIVMILEGEGLGK